MLGDWPETLEDAAIYYGRWRRRGYLPPPSHDGKWFCGYPHPYGRHDPDAVQDRRIVPMMCRSMSGPWVWPGHDVPLVKAETDMLVSLARHGVMCVPTSADRGLLRRLYDLALLHYVRTMEGRRTMSLTRYGRDRLKHALGNAR